MEGLVAGAEELHGARWLSTVADAARRAAGDDAARGRTTGCTRPRGNRVTPPEAWLFDINVLIAIVDPAHVFHESIHRWLQIHLGETWATCPLTENGFVRILAQPAYRGGPFTAVEAIEALARMKAVPDRKYVFWSDTISICDESLVRANRIAGPKQITDVYLAALALRNKGRLVTFDVGVAWQAVAGAEAHLITIPDQV